MLSNAMLTAFVFLLDQEAYQNDIWEDLAALQHKMKDAQHAYFMSVLLDCIKYK